MDFDKTIFKLHYASTIIKMMYIEIAVLLVAILLRILNVNTLFVFSIILIGLIPFVVFPLTFCYYIRMKKQSERQKQWIKEGILYVERCFDSGLTAGGFVNHKETVIFECISSVIITQRFLKVIGDVVIIDVYNGVSKEKKTLEYNIPRVFSNENEIICLGGNSNVR